MKLFFSIITVAVLFVALSCQKKSTNDACFDAELKLAMKDSTCTQFPSGVCGCNGTTYVSECEANKEGYTIIDTVPCSQTR